MGLVFCNEIGRTNTSDHKGIRTYTRTYEVRVDDNTEGPYTVGTYTGVDFGDPWNAGETDNTARMTGASVTPVESEFGRDWRVVLTYSNQPLDVGSTTTGAEPGTPSGEPGQTGQNQEPESRPWQVSGDTVEVSVPLEEDAQVADKAVTTSAGQPYDPPIEVPSYRAQLTITGFKAIANDSFTNMGVYVGKVNEDAFMGYGIGTLLCKKYSLQSQFEHGAYYWSKSVVLEVKLDKWNPIRILDQGTIEIPSIGIDPEQKPRPIMDDTGNPIGSPVPLDGSGKRLAQSEILAGNFHFREFNAYKKISYAGIL